MVWDSNNGGMTVIVVVLGKGEVALVEAVAVIQRQMKVAMGEMAALVAGAVAVAVAVAVALMMTVFLVTNPVREERTVVKANLVVMVPAVPAREGLLVEMVAKVAVVLVSVVRFSLKVVQHCSLTQHSLETL
jgi:hypothetical protein